MSERPETFEPGLTKSSFCLGRWWFLRLLGIVQLAAFVSLWVQVEGLVGSQGILPVADYLDRVREGIGASGYYRAPTLCWLGSGDLALNLLCAAGVVLSILLIAGVATIPVLILSWVVYLSLCVAGQIFLAFQWDVLLLESTFCALFLAPGGWRPRAPWNEPPVHAAGRWLLWFLVFKLMFLSGATKLLSGDPTWRDLSALDFHYWTQPLPTWTSWFAHHTPAWSRKLSVLVMHGIELVVPFTVFLPGIPRRLGALAMILLQLGIAATGNYGFFNLLTAALCVPLLDDAWLARFVPGRWRTRLAGCRGGGSTVSRPSLLWLPVSLVLALSALALVDEVVNTAAPRARTRSGVVAFVDRYVMGWGRPLLGAIGPVRTINGYGLFRSMTTVRPEIALEVSDDAVSWREVDFRWKPDDPAERPRYAATHMPRLDWRLWFAALSPERARPWLERFVARVLDDSPAVKGLLAPHPGNGQPPRYARLVYYRYEFTAPEERARTGDWWRRERLGVLMQPVDRRALKGR